LAEALCRALVNEGNPQTDREQFLALLKPMTVDGYLHIRGVNPPGMEYLGNTYLTAFPECTHGEHQG